MKSTKNKQTKWEIAKILNTQLSCLISVYTFEQFFALSRLPFDVLPFMFILSQEIDQDGFAFKSILKHQIIYEMFLFENNKNYTGQSYYDYRKQK